jgi:biopolymer transport protein ExbD
MSRRGTKRHAGVTDFELNLASIIDCFTVLIAFMLASASFLSIGILDAGVAAAGAAPTNATPPSVTLTVELAGEHAMTVKLGGKVTSTQSLKAKDGTWDYAALTETLGTTKAKYADLAAVTLTADNATEYKDVVKTMETIRKTIPVVMLGGF